MKLLFAIVGICCSGIAYAAEIPQMEAQSALPSDLEVESMQRPVLKKTETPELKSIPAAQPMKLCNAEAFDKIAANTKIAIRIYGHDEISRETVVGPKGTVTIPMVGEVQAENETVQSLAAHIREKLEAANIIAQGVEVEILQYPPIYVTGLVATPGSYEYRPRLNVRQAVTLAGGFGTRARTSDMRILRNTPGNPLAQTEVRANEDTQVLPGDTIEVMRRWF